MAAACALCACDPVEEDGSFGDITVSSQEISEAFSFTQADKEGNPAADGNYFTYSTSPAQIVRVFNYKADGSENLLALGASGTFTIAPGRGSDPNQKFYVAMYNSDGERVVAEKSANVYVKAELSTTEKLFCSDSGRKIYKWNTNAPDGCVWGNMGHCGGNGADVYKTGAGKWWGVTTAEEFEGQLAHSVEGKLTGEESFDAYMVFTEDGAIEKYDGNGAKLGESTYEVVEQTENTEWAKYHLKTGDNSVLWPFEINAGGKYVTEFEVVYISPSAMTLVYPDGGDFKAAYGGWGEASFWQFKAEDYEGCAVGVDGKGKSWTWNTEAADGCVWGNIGYKPGAGETVYASGNGKWWGVAAAEEFEGQLGHAVGGKLQGDESFNAYFTLTPEGEIKKYDGNGNPINTTKYTFNTDRTAKVSSDDPSVWAVAHLETGENSVLWPYEINGGGKYVTDYEVVYIDDSHMTLVYPDGGDFENYGSWGEASFWQFKVKE